MPSTLPARTLVKPMLKHVSKWARIALRVLFVGTVWLAVLPALTYWCWKVGFWLSDYVYVSNSTDGMTN
jgi:E3 ubiquitin-protein ligase MARCH6